LTTATVLIAALSGRGLAASARRAGYLPLVADAFGDSDTAEHAADARCVTDAARIGFRAKPVFSALAELEASAAAPPIGLVLGSGFEDRPKLIAALSRRYRLIGNDAETIARAKDPAGLFALLDTLGIAHPDTQLALPSDASGWLSKRIGGSGGTHVVGAASAERSARRYFQRRLDGEPFSVLAVASRRGVQIVGISRQWTVGTGPRPYRYGGAVGPVDLAPAIDAAMRAAVEGVCPALDLVGLVAFDFLLAGNTPHLLEVNPRPSATLDVFDDASGALFEAHLAACDGRPPQLPASQGARAAAVLYADPRPLTVGAVPWPEWTADRPAPGTRVPRYRPIATVFAAAETPEAAFDSCRRRLDELAEMLYAQAPNRERNNNAEVQRPRPERLGARSEAR
jgi:predicted ATP-grasp superfamily ATP-dependent carboligase